MLVGMSMFMVFQTIPILVRNPGPVGFGEDAISTEKAQLPFAIILLIFGPTSGFIVSKLGSLKPIILGDACLLLQVFHKPILQFQFTLLKIIIIIIVDHLLWASGLVV